MKRLQFSVSATRDLRRLRDFFNEHDPAAAAGVGKRLGRTFRWRRDEPARGRVVGEVRDVREPVAGDYVVSYAGGGDAVVVLRVWHGRQSR